MTNVTSTKAAAAAAAAQATEKSPRVVPGFSTQVSQKNTVTAEPQMVPVVHRPLATAPPCEFAAKFRRAGFPLAASYKRERFEWRVPLSSVNYETYMPMIADGMRDGVRPVAACAALGMWDMLAKDDSGGRRVLEALPRTVLAVRKVLDTGAADWTAVVRGLKTLIKMTQVPGPVANAMVPYYQQLLAPVGRYIYDLRLRDVVCSDGVNVNAWYHLVELCEETLVTLERTGGPCAYVNIKYAIPTYDGRTIPSRAARSDKPIHVLITDSVFMIK